MMLWRRQWPRDGVGSGSSSGAMVTAASAAVVAAAANVDLGVFASYKMVSP